MIGTLVAVDIVVLDDNGPAIDGAVQLGFALQLTEILGWFLGSRARPSLRWKNAQHMASDELVGGYGSGQGRARLGVAGVKDDIGGRDKENVLLRGRALGEVRALGESAEEWV